MDSISCQVHLTNVIHSTKIPRQITHLGLVLLKINQQGCRLLKHDATA